MKTALLIAAWALFLAHLGCDVFLEDLGGAGQPCSNEGTCLDELACNFNKCVEPIKEGRGCEDGIPFSRDPCDEGLRCIDGACVASLPDEVRQPGTDLYWQRCPGGFEWNGWSCTHVSFKYKEGDYFSSDWDFAWRYDAVDSVWKKFNCEIWHGESSLCPEGLRLGTFTEWEALLRNCVQNTTGEGDLLYQCDPCAKSEDCSSVLGITSKTVYGDGEKKVYILAKSIDDDYAYYDIVLETGKVFPGRFLAGCALCLRDDN